MLSHTHCFSFTDDEVVSLKYINYIHDFRVDAEIGFNILCLLAFITNTDVDVFILVYCLLNDSLYLKMQLQ